MKLFTVATVIAGMFCSGAAIATTGNELSDQCQAFIKDPTPPSMYFASGVCGGYINGMIDGLHIARALSPDRVGVCFPDDGFTNFQAVKVVQRYLVYCLKNKCSVKSSMLAR
ncbi:Rap1a/Tai family immunity protein [Pseudomonas syringae pv. actinidiae]|uniref:Rap1a/Tai family immunity protein n=1 Tax=Pseudomonas syringae TaxID=317 RepID=UPI001562A2E1|nr:Rap1a/Tai family immunity protein [Pseudomonas syringae]MDU8614619.1 Rap1a/Tai family immunity protein [Pseudomonas syringae pv. actinidiae]